MIFMSKFKGVSVLNTVESLEIVPVEDGEAMEVDRVQALWGPDPVHPDACHLMDPCWKKAPKLKSCLVRAVIQ